MKINSLLICTFDADIRKVGQFATLEKSQVLGTIFFFSLAPIIFPGLQTFIFICQEHGNPGAGLKYNVHLKS